MSASRNSDKASKSSKDQRVIINALYKESLGYVPMRMKPVHFATSFLLCLHQRYFGLELLNKAANPKAEEKCAGDEYVADNLYRRLVESTEPIIDSTVNIEALKLLRNHLNAAYNNDGAALGPAFPPYKTFGCDYSTPSLGYLGNLSKNHGNAGALVWLVLNSTADGKQFLALAKDIATRAEGPATALGLPFLVDEEEKYEEEITRLCGDPSLELLTAISQLMKPQTETLLRLAKNLQNHPSSYALRKLIIGVGSWLLVYQIRKIPGAGETIFFCDFAGDSRPQLRTQAMACYARQLGLFGRSIRLWLNYYPEKITEEIQQVIENYEVDISKELEDHFRDFSVRIGWVQPRSSAVKQKFFRAVPDTMSVLLLSILDQGDVFTMDEVAGRLREHWRLVVGLLPEDHAILRQHGYTPLDEDADLRVNRDAFKRLAIQLGFAWEPSDGLVLFSLTPDQFS